MYCPRAPIARIGVTVTSFDTGTMAFFQCGAIRLMIGLAEEAAAIGGTIVYFNVQDIQTVHGVLEGRSVEFIQSPHLVARLRERGFALLEVQYLTEHLAQFGVVEIPHKEYMRQLGLALELECVFGGELGHHGSLILP